MPTDEDFTDDITAALAGAAKLTRADQFLLVANAAQRGFSVPAETKRRIVERLRELQQGEVPRRLRRRFGQAIKAATAAGWLDA
jgi:hypothetical protein